MNAIDEDREDAFQEREQARQEIQASAMFEADKRRTAWLLAQLDKAEAALAASEQARQRAEAEVLKWESVYGKWPGGPAVNMAYLAGFMVPALAPDK